MGRPQGREKRVGTGQGNVFRRGQGLGGGPVGNFSGEREPDLTNDDSQRGSGYGGGGGGGGPVFGGGMLKKLLPLVVVVIIVIAATRMCGPDNGQSNITDPSLGASNYSASQNTEYSNNADNYSTDNYTDSGAYAVNNKVSSLARDKFTNIRGGGQDTVTMLIYMIGTDLESKSGAATKDLQEILNADISDKLNIVIQTGGCSRWQNNIVSSDTIQRYKATSSGLEVIDGNVGDKPMVDENVLGDFIKFGAQNYPADRYMLVLWDHGGGSLSGYGYDEKYSQYGSMGLDKLSAAFKKGGVKFDILGFDACLMATLETSIVAEETADYLIASEETEPGCGWYYTNFISELSKNTSMKSTDLGKKIIDDFVSVTDRQAPGQQTTLSLIDLAEFKGTVPKAFTEFSGYMQDAIDKKQYNDLANARVNTKEFAKGHGLNQIDLIGFANKFESAKASEFADALTQCVKYSRSGGGITGANGIAVYFPYGDTRSVGTMLSTYDKIGINPEYSQCIRSFASVAAGGQMVSNSGGNPLGSLLGSLSMPAASTSGNSNPLTSLLGMFLSSQGMGSPQSAGGLSSVFQELLGSGMLSSLLGNRSVDYDWIDAQRVADNSEYYLNNTLDAKDLVPVEKNGNYVLKLSEKQWSVVSEIELNVFVDDGSGFIDLGLDNTYEYDEDGDLIMNYDGTWLSLNGNIVAYYLVSESTEGDSYSYIGRVPAMLNDEKVYIIVSFDDENPYGAVLGAQTNYDKENETATITKGLTEIVEGDEIDFLCDYYTYDAQYSDTYFLGEKYTYDGEGFTLENLSIGDLPYSVTYRITDMYGNKYWTQAITGN